MASHAPRDLAAIFAEGLGAAHRTAVDRVALCEAVAAWLATPAGLRQARQLQAAGELEDALPGALRPAGGGARRTAARRPEPIAIWEPREIDGERVFVRPAPHPLGDHHAERAVLRPKRAELPLRVCLFGESVAAGYLYAPRLTPAQVLEGQLRAALGRDDFEVVDLARTNETLGSLADTVRTSLQINPDVLVLFAGNNWNLLETPEVSPYAPSVRARQRYAAALREGGPGGAVRLAEDALRAACERAFELIGLIAQAVQIPVVVVVPEVNLADWESRQPVLRLPGDAVTRWHELQARASALLDRGEPTAAALVADAMLALDGGRCPTTWRLRARARAGLGDDPGARADLLAEVDAAQYATLACLDSPRATTAARALLHEMAARHHLRCLDLREVFGRHTGGALPGRRLFLDYCHLTLEGIRVAMAAVAAEVLRLSGMTATDEPWPDLLARLPAADSASGITPEAEATARLGAAVHTAHRLLAGPAKRPLLEHWLEAALAASPGVAAAMLDLLEARCAACPAVLTPAQQRNLASPYRLTLQHGWRWDHLDADLLEALVAVLERHGTPARERAARLLVAHHGLGPAGTDLADPFWHWEPLARFLPEVMDFADLERRATHRAPWPESAFALVCDGSCDLELVLTARLPAAPGSGAEATARLAVNEHEIGAIALGREWRSARLDVPAPALHPGLNRLTVRWPPPPPAGDSPLTAVADRLALGLAADLHPVFGEVWSLLARPRDGHPAPSERSHGRNGLGLAATTRTDSEEGRR